MRYWNKQKDSRQHWTKVTCRVPFAQAKRWCQQQEGRTRFYSGPWAEEWYFESSQDALAFKLRWATNSSNIK